MCDKQALEGWMSAFPLDAASGCTVPTGCCHLMIHFLFTYKVPLCSSRVNISLAVISRFSLPGLREPEVEAESKTRKLAGRAAFLLRFFTNNAFPDSSCVPVGAVLTLTGLSLHRCSHSPQCQQCGFPSSAVPLMLSCCWWVGDE